ncbi:MAG TPA: bifunctional (p)ppGpp synthetase/guanosine-3',5'-bis(diphosphate) 3'-pyrophosphohydrolase, partial [Thermoanaerobaculia bacterium]|nr:bifunctional (p)ppGpp synthetase/guanosine-3',5'-bis(diphosphate) 3'-pyrophosphohydrolase [Thermoanaerobaculia bacterium]
MLKIRSRLKPPVAPPKHPTLDGLLDLLKTQNSSFDEALLRRAHAFSAEKHAGQKRRSGQPYFTHPLAVAYHLAELKFDELCVSVGLLHDVLEDTLTSREVLESTFGAEIAELVDGVTKIGRHAYVRRDEAQAQTFRKLILASAKDVRVILVKLADRLHNMETLEYVSPETRRRVALETLEIYAPLAHRLGMAKVKGELEDLAFYYLWPHQFAEVHDKVQEKMSGAREAMERIRVRLQQTLEEAGISAEISYRVKRFYSIYQKLRRLGVDVSQLYDYLAFRIITPSLRDTYAALGVVHQSWRPIPGRFKDYIAMPKPNRYQSLHTTVLAERGQPFEVQIRTREMDLVAEEGIAAHWHYKEGNGGPPSGDDRDPNITWLRQLLEWQKELKDDRSFMNALKIDLYPDEVYVFTPKGEVFSFPRDAMPLDFAYRVHTEVGHHTAGARVNGKLVPLRTLLRNGDIVEILTDPSRQPSRDWLNLVATSRAKSKIRHWLSTQQKQKATEIGRRLLDRELRRYKVNPKKVAEGAEMTAYLTEHGLTGIEDLYSRVGFGKVGVRQVLTRLLGEERLQAPPQKPSRLRQAVERMLPSGGTGPILVKGQNDLLAVMAKCCSPLPGEEIVGYVTRGRGVSVHSADCPNVRNLHYNPEREIEVEWARSDSAVFPVTLRIETEDEPGVLARLTEAISKGDTNIRQIEAESVEPNRGLVRVLVEVKSRRHLERLEQGIQAVSGVREVGRAMGGSS